ncbi:uncharacterized protein UTRI_00792_B [Ustilago trichophora]|uniref:C2H2-type domain-containing protein n=1 Tax=Ustilago trichophora TaxID=86804 RepID=A0A5C3DQ12_9BASI|nr:uncharacterized protein UTRI_00792_B [Ustilago trichophora]
MDRNVALWSASGRRVEAALDGLPARSSSAPPNRPDDLVMVEEAETTLTAAGAPSSNFTFMQTSEWVESHYLHDNNSASPAAQDGPLYPGLTSQNGHHLSLGESPSETMQALANDSRSHSMPSLFNTTQAITSGLASYNRLHNTGLPEAMPSYSVPVCAFSANNGHFGPTGTADVPFSSEELRLAEHRHSKHRGAHADVRDEEHDGRQQSIASRVRALGLSSPPPLIPFPTHHGLGLIEDDASNKAVASQTWMHAAPSGEHCVNSMLRLPYLDEALHSGLPGGAALSFGSSQDRNPMWGSAEHYAIADFGNDHKDFYGIGLHGHEHSTTTGGTSSLASSRSLPELTWSSTDPWLSRPCSDWLHDEDEGSALARRESTTASGTAPRCTTYSVSAASTAGASANPCAGSEDVANHRDSRTLLNARSHAMGDRPGGNRMEEGEIGSKRRIWYRAPNGQFASATQALSGQLSGDGSGNGEGSSRGSEGGIRRIRRRRKSEEVERKYRCDFDGCNKAYGTLNPLPWLFCSVSHPLFALPLLGAWFSLPTCPLLSLDMILTPDLNTHRATNEHGPRLNAVGYRRAHADWLSRQAAGQGV